MVLDLGSTEHGTSVTWLFARILAETKSEQEQCCVGEINLQHTICHVFTRHHPADTVEHLHRTVN
jgi:hypothetical protein